MRAPLIVMDIRNEFHIQNDSLLILILQGLDFT